LIFGIQSGEKSLFYVQMFNIVKLLDFISRKSEFLGENDEEMDKNIVDNSYSYLKGVQNYEFQKVFKGC
jgi:hypothetical protein